MDASIDPFTRDYTGQRIATLANAVHLRLDTPLGSWWADPALGSRLHELARAKDLSRIDLLARQYTEQALDPLLKDGRATRLAVTTSRPQPGWLWLQIEVEDASGQIDHFRHPVRVGG